MESFIIFAALGILCILMGISNMKGNLSTIHSYHRRRVSEADRIPFGRLVGLGTIISGGALGIFSVFSALNFFTDVAAFTVIGTVILILGIVVGLCMSFYAMIKYNKGIF